MNNRDNRGCALPTWFLDGSQKTHNFTAISVSDPRFCYFPTFWCSIKYYGYDALLFHDFLTEALFLWISQEVLCSSTIALDSFTGSLYALKKKKSSKMLS